jgi:hypothetical protein
MSAELPVAIIGIGCKLPGGSDTKDLYYDFLRNKVGQRFFLSFSILTQDFYYKFPSAIGRWNDKTSL